MAAAARLAACRPAVLAVPKAPLTLASSLWLPSAVSIHSGQGQALRRDHEGRGGAARSGRRSSDGAPAICCLRSCRPVPSASALPSAPPQLIPSRSSCHPPMRRSIEPLLCAPTMPWSWRRASTARSSEGPSCQRFCGTCGATAPHVPCPVLDQSRLHRLAARLHILGVL